jgi:hypothetical protein
MHYSYELEFAFQFLNILASSDVAIKVLERETERDRDEGARGSVAV